MLIVHEGGDASFAATFCTMGLVSSIYRSASFEAYVCVITLLVFLLTYLHMFPLNVTLQCGSHADCLTDRRVTLSSGTYRTSLNFPSFFFPSTLNMRWSVPFPVVKISESSPRLIGVGFDSVTNDDGSNRSRWWVIWLDAPESGCTMKTLWSFAFP